MVSGFLNRQHANRLMLEQGLSALVLAQPESITYAAGAFPGVAANWRRAGAAFLVVPCDAAEPLTAIVGDLQADTFKARSGSLMSDPIPYGWKPDNTTTTLIQKMWPAPSLKKTWRWESVRASHALPNTIPKHPSDFYATRLPSGIF